MFNNIKIGTRVAMGFFLVLVIFTGVSIYSIYQMRVLGEYTDRLYKHPFTVSKAVREIETHLTRMHRGMKDLILSANTFEQNTALDTVEKSAKEIIELTRILNERFLGNIDDVKNFKERFFQWKKIREELIQINNTGNKDAAIAFHKRTGSPFVEDMERDLSRIKDFANNKAKDFLDSLHKEERKANLFIIVILSSAIILSLLVALLISNSIKNPLKTAVEASDRLALGDVSVSFGKITNDETGRLFESMQIMTDNFKGLTIAADTIANGDLSVEINPRSEFDKLGLSMQIMAQNLRKSRELSEQQAFKLHETHSILEMHQQETQQQAEELKINNLQLEEQQQQLQKQTEELRIKNENLERVSQKLEQTNKYKSEFLANMSHELRTPLNSIVLLSKLLSLNQDKTIGDKEIEKIKTINHAGKELLRLINDLLDISKIEAGKVTISKTRFNSSLLIEENRNMFTHVASEKGVDFILEDRLKKNIYTDKGKLSQILRNFLANSFKFTKKGAVRFVIEKNDDPLYPVKFSVTDSGIGIPKDKLEIIFEAFTQVDGSISREYGGTGLGLCISKALAHIIGGNIAVQSEEGKGTTITLFLKTTVSEDVKGIAGEKNFAISKAAAEKIKNGSCSNKKILIVDDDLKNIFLMKSALEDLGAELYEAKNGKEALELMKKQKFDLVLMDIMMPVMDGYQAMKIIRANEKFKDVPVIAVTAKALKEDYLKCIEAGADDYLTKPIDYDNMIPLLKGWIDRNDHSIQTR